MLCVQLNVLDELMCSELQEDGKPELPSYGMGELASHSQIDPIAGLMQFLHWTLLHRRVVQDALRSWPQVVSELAHACAGAAVRWRWTLRLLSVL